MNAQFAVQGDRVYLLEVNPRASRTVPFISKAIGKPLAKIAVDVILGKTLREMGYTEDLDLGLTTFNVKAPVFPFNKFPGVDTLLGPEMKSTGEVMGRGRTFASAFAKAMTAAGMRLPTSGNVFFSIRNEDKAEALSIARGLQDLGFKIFATSGTAKFLNSHFLTVTEVKKQYEGSPNCVEQIRDGHYQLVINTASDYQAIKDSFHIRRAVLERKVPHANVIASARAILQAVREEKRGPLEIMPL
jgi:carbamoyl-phosphate synthase large subunit